MIEKMKARAAELNKKITQSQSISEIAFVVMAENELIDDVTLTENADIFPVWDENWTGRVGAIVRHNAKLFRKINSDFNTPFPQSIPGEDASQWLLIGDPGDEWPPWSRPLGAHDAYPMGAQVTHNERRWISEHDANVWEPGAWGWREV